jgi:hypothetical protein
MYYWKREADQRTEVVPAMARPLEAGATVHLSREYRSRRSDFVKPR